MTRSPEELLARCEVAHNLVNNLKYRLDHAKRQVTKDRLAEEIVSQMDIAFCMVASAFPYGERDDIRAECRLVLANYLSGRWSCATKKRVGDTDFYALVYWRCGHAAKDWMDTRSVFARRNCPGSAVPVTGEFPEPAILPLSLDRGDGSWADTIPDPDNEIKARESEIAAQGVISRLPSNQQDVFYLRAFGDYEYRDIARMLGLSRMTTYRLYASAAHKIASALNPHHVLSLSGCTP